MEIMPVAQGAPLTESMERSLGPWDVISVEQTPRAMHLLLAHHRETKLYCSISSKDLLNLRLSKSMMKSASGKSSKHRLQRLRSCAGRLRVVTVCRHHSIMLYL